MTTRMDIESLKTKAGHWISAWNARDLEQILSHYSDDVEFYSATAEKLWKKPEGKIIGKIELRKHFEKGFSLQPDLRFEWVDILTGTDGILLLYKHHTGKTVGDYVMFNEEGKVKQVRVFCS